MFLALRSAGPADNNKQHGMGSQFRTKPSPQIITSTQLMKAPCYQKVTPNGMTTGF